MASSNSKENPQQLSLVPPEAWVPLLRLARLASRPLERFLHVEAASGLVLIGAALIAIYWANSPWGGSYEALLHTPIGVRFGGWVFERDLEWVVNDVLMTVFFFVVGMEIRREMHCGELSEWRRAALPAVAALGGMLVPAAIYLALAGAPETRSGWGVPIATDIAFAIGVLTLLGKRVPPALRVLLLALAVIDDLGAIGVIAIFYTSGVKIISLLLGLVALASIVVLQRIGVRSRLVYAVPSVIAWGAIYASGIHPTIAGVAVGLLTPVRAWHGVYGFIAGLRRELDGVDQAQQSDESVLRATAALRNVEEISREAISPAERLIEALHPWVAFGIMPLFALANAGVRLSGEETSQVCSRIVTATAFGLIGGKLIGVLLTTEVFTRLGICDLPNGISRRHIIVLGAVAGIGFTMSLFVAKLAFQDVSQLASAKVGVLLGSLIASVLALVLGRWLLTPVTAQVGVAESADEAEASTEA